MFNLPPIVIYLIMIKNPRTPDYREKLENSKGEYQPLTQIVRVQINIGQISLENFFFTTVILGSRVWVTNLV